MKKLQLVLVIVAVLVPACIARADSVPDPKIVVAASGYSQVLTDPFFSFTATGAGGGSFDFYNNSGLNWTGLSLATAMPYGLIDGEWAPLASPDYYNLSSDLFRFSALDFGTNRLAIRFWGTDDTYPGIPTVGGSIGPLRDPDYNHLLGSHFFINLDNSIEFPGVGGWLGADYGPLAFQAWGGPASLPVPEPATGLLFLGGAAALGLGALRRKASSRRRS